MEIPYEKVGDNRRLLRDVNQETLSLPFLCSISAGFSRVMTRIRLGTLCLLHNTSVLLCFLSYLMTPIMYFE